MDRRRFLTGAASLAALVGCKQDRPLGLDDSGTFLTTATGAPIPGCPDPMAGGTFLEVVPWDPPRAPFGALTDVGWDARRLFELASLADGGSLEVPPDRFYVRTGFPDLLTTAPDAWTVRLDGRVDAATDIPIADIRARAVDHDPVLLECSGNGGTGHFGLMSAARWRGAPLLDLLDAHATLDPTATQLLVTGFDEHSVPSEGGHSTPGASWVFPLSELGDAFLATGLGGQDLPPDNGHPVRLIVPGWYGCSAIKWVTGLTLVGDDAPSTGQMLEFASRIHQDGEPALAVDFAPARQQISATPIQVEKWRVDGRIAYRVVGLLWGGDRLVDTLTLRLGAIERTAHCFEHVTTRTWNLWSHRWDPSQAGRFTLSCAVESTTPQIRLDLGWYDREIEIPEPAGPVG